MIEVTFTPKEVESMMQECALKAIAILLNQIRTEIMQLDYDLESVDYDYNDMPHTEEVHMICREEVLQIIDNYKAERSEE